MSMYKGGTLSAFPLGSKLFSDITIMNSQNRIFSLAWSTKYDWLQTFTLRSAKSPSLIESLRSHSLYFLARLINMILSGEELSVVFLFDSRTCKK